MSTANPVAPCDFVVFGGTGDLAVRKLLPALYLRDRDGQLPADTRIIAASRAGLDESGYRDKVRGELGRFVAADALDEETVHRFLARLRLREHRFRRPRRLASADRSAAGRPGQGPGVLPGLRAQPVRPDLRALASHHLVDESSRVVLEKPIGHDLASAQAINDAVGAVFEESQIFRIDHYLGKESVQNLLVTRFANTFLEPLWNSSWIDHVQITVVRVARRGHPRRVLRQLRRAARHGAEPPAAGAVPGRHGTAHLRRPRNRPRRETQGAAGAQADDARRRRALHRRRPVRTRAWSDGVAVAGYKDDAENPDSRTETFAAVKAEVRNWRWAGVPFYLRTGKRMEQRCSEIVIVSSNRCRTRCSPTATAPASPTNWSSSCSPRRACACT